MVAVAMNATALGLLLSTVVASAEAAMALTPIALIPQVVLGGLMVPMTTNPMLQPLMYVDPARWGFEGRSRRSGWPSPTTRRGSSTCTSRNLSSAADFVMNGKFQCATAQMGSDALAGAWGFIEWSEAWMPLAVLYAMTVLMLSVLLVMLKRRDPV
jgi:hypothetical protein